jgi:hypothetical protein
MFPLNPFGKVIMNRIPLSHCLLIALLSMPDSGKAWDGYDHRTRHDIEIMNNGALLPDEETEIYDYRDSSYHDVRIVSIRRDDATEIEVYDYKLDDYRTFEMEILKTRDGE